ncbi:MAG: metallophosphoesterase [Cyanobacteria bacterium P01_H01_bin.105]
MSRPILLAQVTDSHLLAQTTAQLRGCNPWQSIKAVLQQVAQYKPDGLLLTGDLAEQGEGEAYGHLVDAIASALTGQVIPLPIYWLPGNHDHLDTLRQTFQTLPASHGLTSIDLGVWQLILLDSVLPQSKFGEGYLVAEQLHKLRFWLKKHPLKPTLIALHHHPVPVGIDWVDQMQVQNACEFHALINQFSNVRLVVFGHIHHEFRQQSAKGPSFYGCPSTCLQVTSPKLGLLEENPGFRLFWLYGDGTYKTEVRRVSDACAFNNLVNVMSKNVQ